jgi:hypothetical protein
MKKKFTIIVIFFAAIASVLQGFSSNPASLSIRLYDANHVLVKEYNQPLKSSGEFSFTIEREYVKGDRLVIEGTNNLFVQFDEHIPGSYVYSPTGRFNYPVPVKENGLNYPKESFSGSQHQLKIGVCDKKEWSAYRNLALNPFDVRGETDFYPHATSNSECRGESFYAARNAIDGYKLNTKHGQWPYQAWGPDTVSNLWFKIDFAKTIEIDKLVIVNRAQYSDDHDSYWEKATVEFSDGTREEIKIEKTPLPQEIRIKKHRTSWINFSGLKEFEHKWCSWIEVEAWGRDVTFGK